MEEVTQVCLSGLPEVVGIVSTTVITIAAAASNIIGKTSKVGKVVNWFGLNFTVEKKQQ